MKRASSGQWSVVRWAVPAFAIFLVAAMSMPLRAQGDAGQRVPDAAQFVGAPKGLPLAGDALNSQTTEVSSMLRCPVCQGLSVADSPSAMAVNMKEQVRELLARGYTKEQILSYFERSYGQFVLLKPKFQGVNALVWILPIAALILGAVIVVTKVKRLEQPAIADEGAKPADDGGDAKPQVKPDKSAPVAPPIAEVDDELMPYVLRVRELAYGWPGGIDPATKENR
ncbi:MAG TPA: cytochrome c-type biogenesis protein [Thermoanaerobaculia bacterium]|nr:cytochrome c-type biogenesis protein [Thermoanaerobaculia bacterium]